MTDSVSLTSILPALPETLKAIMPTLTSQTAGKTAVDVANISLTFGTTATKYAIMTGMALGIVLVGWMLSKWLMTRTHNTLIRARISETPAQFLASTVRFVVLLAAFIVALIQLGVPAASLVAIFGALTLALGLGLKDTLTNVAAGIMLLVNRPFETGDIIQLDTYRGTVKRINLFQTEMNTTDNVRIFVPNLLIWNNAIQNYTHNRVRMVEVLVGLDYRHTAEECRACIHAALAAEPLILREPAPFVGLDTLADSAVTYLIRVWVKTADWGNVRYTLLERIKAEANTRGLSIPFPQRVLHMAPTPPPATSKPKPRKKRHG